MPVRPFTLRHSRLAAGVSLALLVHLPEAWLTRAQKRVAKAWLAEHENDDG